MKFTKVHSLGNDFLIVDLPKKERLSSINDLARTLCDRHTGVGADGLLLISVQSKTKGTVNFRIFNADGTEAEVSGNGLRCAAASLHFHKKIESPSILFFTTAGERECELIDRKKNSFLLKIDMGVPHFKSQEIPFDDGAFHENIIDYPLSINQKIYPITLVSVGNPHCAIFVDRFPSRFEWHQIGSEIESHPFFPNRTNIEFIRVISKSEIEVQFWERGVGETLSSGSGACAAAVASILKNQTDRRVKVRTSMGNLTVEWDQERVFQTGPSEVVFEGNYFC